MAKLRAIWALSALVIGGGVAIMGASAIAEKPPHHVQKDGTAEAIFINRNGDAIGHAVLTPIAYGVSIKLDVSLPAGERAFHIHEKGDCGGEVFANAGGHFNPHGHKHGNHAGHAGHAGDLPNLTFLENGRVVQEIFVHGISLIGGSNPLLDADGAALVIHETADDYVTDPAGNAGGRIACAVIKPVEDNHGDKHE